MKPEIRLAVPRDAGAINTIYNHYVLHSTCTYQIVPSTAGEREAWMAAHGERYPVVVAELAGEVVGWASLSPFHPREAYRFTVENSVYVHHQHHRRGIGAALLNEILACAGVLEYRSVIALISADQTASVELHARAGFREAGTLQHVGYKFNRWLDVLYMQWANPSLQKDSTAVQVP